MSRRGMEVMKVVKEEMKEVQNHAKPMLTKTVLLIRTKRKNSPF